MINLQGQTALVTGAAQGIGFGIAQELARAGCNVVIADQALEKARQAVARIKEMGQEAIAIALDVTDESAVRAGVMAAIDHFKRVDILVNNAGVHSEKIGQRSTVEQFNKCWDVNLLGVWRVVVELVPHFKANGGGKIVNIASINAYKPMSGAPAYSASKAALVNLTRSLATELGENSINVNAVCPGGVITAMADQFVKERPDIRESVIRSRLLKRELLPEDIGHAVVFLVSRQAQNITGQCLNVDGGRVFG